MTDHFLYDTDDTRWHALVNRVIAADGSFYYGVKTTGIFCRPSCPSRLPRRENVEFFADCEEAQTVGYRPCKRCKPEGRSIREETDRKITHACRRIEQSDHRLKLKDLAEEAGLSPYHFHRLFKKLIGVTPKQYESGMRWQQFRKNLKGSVSVTDAIYSVGYSSSSGVYTKSKDKLSMTPKEYKEGGGGMIIYYGIAECFLGWIIVAATDLGICAVEFGDDQDALPGLIQSRFKNAEIEKAGPGFTQVIEEVIAFIKAPQEPCTLPLDIQGTAFQLRVWELLRQIEPGETLSYTEVAEKIGNPRAVRAVATACASNALAVIIPCHRVISKDGRLAGYKWGLERKKMLLVRESGEEEMEH